jgi:hypothetical protein
LVGKAKKGGRRVKKLFFLGLVVSLALSLSSAAHANMLLNAGFESGGVCGVWPDSRFGAAVIDNWTTTGIDGYYTNEFNHTAGGARSAKIWDDASVIHQDVAVDAGTAYAFKAYMYTALGDNLKAGWNGITKVEWYNGVNKLSTDEIGRYYPLVDVTGAWKYVAGTLTAPSTATTARVIGTLVDVGGTYGGAMSWDDLDVAAVPEPVSLFLLGPGLVGLFGLTKKESKK